MRQVGQAATLAAG